MVRKQDYVLLGISGVNRYYVAAERCHEIQELRQPEELSAIYKIINYADCRGYLFDKYMSYRAVFYKSVHATAVFLERTPLSRKAK